MTKLLVGITIGVGFLAHLLHFGNVPVGVNRDEAALGYNAYSLLKTGKDERGNPWPVQFASFGDWKAPVYFYLTIPFVGVGGLSETTVRLPAFFAAIFLSVGILFIAFELRPNLKQSPFLILGILLLSFNPWLFHFSRVAYEATVAVAFATWGIYLFHFRHRYFFGALLLSLALFTYHAAVIVIPPLALALILFSKKVSTVHYIAALALLTVTIGIVLWRTFFTAEHAKGQAILLFNDSNENLYETIYKHRDGSFLKNLQFNKVTYYAPRFLGQWIANYSPKALTQPVAQAGVHDLPRYGRFMILEYLLALGGVFYLVLKRNGSHLFFLFWLAIAPIPAAITKASIHTTRSIFLLPVILILALVGLSYFRKLKPMFSLPLLALCLLISGTMFVYHYLTVYPAESEKRFNGYYKPICHEVQKLLGEGKEVIIGTPQESPYIFCAFYNRIDPAYFQKTIRYYAPDREGFQHAKALDKMSFPSLSPQFTKKEDFADNTVGFTRPSGTPEFVRQTRVWNNRLGEVEFFEWRIENQ